MALVGALDFLSHLDNYRIVSITGWRGSGKDLLATELSYHYLKQGMAYYSNQRCVWNDPLYYDKTLPNTPVAEGESMAGLSPVVIRLPWARKRVYQISEGGRYLRKWQYFENMFEFTRKLKDIILIPSVRVGHEDLAQLLVFPLISMKMYFGINGGLWGWQVDTGLNRTYGGWFYHYPTIGYGTYDTEDFSENTNMAVNTITEEVERTQREVYGRDGIQQVAGGQDALDEEWLSTIRRKWESIAVSVSSQGHKF